MLNNFSPTFFFSSTLDLTLFTETDNKIATIERNGKIATCLSNTVALNVRERVFLSFPRKFALIHLANRGQNSYFRLTRKSFLSLASSLTRVLQTSLSLSLSGVSVFFRVFRFISVPVY